MSISSPLQAKSLFTPRFQRRTLGITVLSLLLAMILPLLVLLDRWFDNQQISSSLSDWWYQEPPLSGLAWPPYFVIVSIGTLAVIVLVFASGAVRMDRPEISTTSLQAAMPLLLQRSIGFAFIILGEAGVFATIVRLSKPHAIAGWDYFFICTLYITGWCLFTVPLKKVWQFSLTNGFLILALFLGLTVVCWLLFSYFGKQRINFPLLALTLTAIWMLYRRRHKISPGYWLFLLALIVFTLGLNTWYFSFIGDEYVYYDMARHFAENPNMVEIGKNIFDATFIYDMQPFFSSLMQAVSLKLFDLANFGWRFSSIFPSAFSIIFFYYFFRTFLMRWVAFTGTFMIAVSQYLMAFSRIGYNSTQALLAMSMALAAVAWAVKSRQHLAFVVSGVSLAFCFYVFPAALYIPPLILWFLLLYHPPSERSAWVDWIILGNTILILLVPLFFQSDYWAMLLGGTFLGTQDHISTSLQVVQHILMQFAYAFYSFLFIIHESHYVTVSYMDGLTAVFVLIGLGALFQRLRTDKFAFFVFSGFALLLLFVGATHQYDAPPNTRMFLLVPWFSLIAAIGLQWLAVRFAQIAPSMGLARCLLAGLLLFMLGLNLYQAYGIGVQRSSTCCQNFEPAFIRLAQNLAAQPKTLPQTIELVYDPVDHDIWRLRQLIEVEYLRIQVREIVVSSAKPPDLQGQLWATDQVVAISPFLPEPVQAAYQASLSSHQRVECQIISAAGQPRFNVWYPSAMASPCMDLP